MIHCDENKGNNKTQFENVTNTVSCTVQSPPNLDFDEALYHPSTSVFIFAFLDIEFNLVFCITHVMCVNFI